MSGQRVLFVEAYGLDRLVDQMDKLVGKETMPMGPIISEILQFKIMEDDKRHAEFMSSGKRWYAIVLVKTEPVCQEHARGRGRGFC